ncbi:MAG: hypothetical protein QOK11_4217, partial [Pseudonocardiales bacterium]|nr:hypothetical protein [Pseudonocardiales bacterium]
MIELDNEGIDTLLASITRTLDTNVGESTLTGSSAVNGTGNELDNVLIGNGHNHVLAGLGGADHLDGGAGTGDTASYAASAAGVIVSLTTGLGSSGDAEGDTLSNIERLIGSNADDTLEGNSGNNVLAGGTNGAAGDTASCANAAAGVTVNLATTSAQNTVGAGSDTLTGLENLIGSAFNDVLIGSSVANVINGGNGNDTITGGGGLDTVIGGSGSDKFVLTLWRTALQQRWMLSLTLSVAVGSGLLLSRSQDAENQ